jgi:hypothetical protein
MQFGYFISFAGGSYYREEWTIESTRSSVQTAKEKKIGLPKELRVPVLH